MKVALSTTHPNWQTKVVKPFPGLMPMTTLLFALTWGLEFLAAVSLIYIGAQAVSAINFHLLTPRSAFGPNIKSHEPFRFRVVQEASIGAAFVLAGIASLTGILHAGNLAGWLALAAAAVGLMNILAARRVGQLTTPMCISWIPGSPGGLRTPARTAYPAVMRLMAADTGCRRLADSGRQGWEIGKWFLSALCFAAVLTVLAVPARAEAKPGYKVRPAGVKLVLLAGKTSGYSISVIADARQRVWLAIELPTSTIEYSTKGRVTGRRIAADFGALGRIDVRWRLAGSGSEPAPTWGCKGRGSRYWEAAYRGKIELTRESGVPRISVKHGRAMFERRFRQVCKRRHPRPTASLFPKLTRKLEEGSLIVSGKNEDRTVRFWANIFAFRRHPAHSGGTVGATVQERDGGVQITRRTGRFFYNSVIMSRRDSEPETIEVKPPPPFSGRALYSRTADSPATWTGQLGVTLPGTDPIPLTGLGFSPVLCRGRIGSCLSGSGSVPSR